MKRDDQKFDISKIAKRMVRTNQDIIGELQRKRDDDSVLAVSGEDKTIAWKSYHEMLLNTSFAWNGNSLSQADTISEVPHLTDQIRESISKMKNTETAGPSGLLSKMVRVAGEARTDLFSDLSYQIIVVPDYRIIKAKWELSTIVITVREKEMP